MPSRRQVGTFLYFVSLFLTGVLVVLTVGREASFPADFWKTPPDWVPWARVAGAVAGVSLPIQLEIARRKQRASKAVTSLTSLSRAMYHEFVDGKDAMYPATGVHVWRLAKIGAIGQRRDVLERVVSFRVVQRAESRIDWAMGKGIIGECWGSGEAQIADLRPLRAAFDAGQATFEAIPVAQRNNLSFDEYRQVREYAAIYAQPLFVGRRLVGCVSIDCTLGDSYAQLDVRRSRGSVAELAALMGSSLAGEE